MNNAYRTIMAYIHPDTGDPLVAAVTVESYATTCSTAGAKLLDLPINRG